MTNTLPDKPTAKVIVDGLFTLCVNKQERYAELGVYEFADGHDFSLKISKLTRKEELIGEVIEIKPQRGGAFMKNISIKVKNRLSDLDVYYDPSFDDALFLSDPMKTKMENPANHKRDFRWMIDLEGKLFHKRKLSITPGTLNRRIRIYNGVISTKEVKPRIVKFAFPEAARLIPNTLPADRIYVAKQIAIDLVADSPENSVTISYDNETFEKRNKISLAPADDYYYEIFINNNCPEADASRKHFSDFQHYYNVFSEVAAGERYDFEVYVKGGGNKIAPCDLIYLGQHDEL